MMKQIVFLACALTFIHGATVDIEWVVGMTENEVCVAPGDVINFNYHSGHNVEVTDQAGYDGCVVTQTEEVHGPISWTAPAEEGITYTICGVALHCALGNQKLAITVSNSC